MNLETGVDAARVDALVQERVREDGPGCAVGVYRAGELVFARGYGLADLERPAPITPATVFDIGSTSKQFTAACVLLLAREGALGLDDDIRRFLPELPELGGTITVRHLVHHLSGIRDYINLTVLAGRSLDNDWTEQEVLDLLARQRALDFAPGTRHSYSNSGYFLLGEIVRRVSGRTLRAFAEERIFRPLGMAATSFRDDRTELIPGRALAYASAEGGHRLDMSLWDVVGDGGLQTTVEDLARWDAQFYDCELPGGAELIGALTTPGRLADGGMLDYAFGLSIGREGGTRTIHHGGSWGGYRAELIRFPELRTAVAVLANLAGIDAGGLARAVARVVLEQELEPAPQLPAASGPAPLPDGLAGFYVDSARTLLIELAEPDGGAVVRLQGAELPLEAAPGGVLRVCGYPVDVVPVGGDRVRFEIREHDGWTLARLGVPPNTVDDLPGTYRSEELDATYVVESAAEGLTIRCGPQPALPLVAAGGDVFGFAHGVVTVDRSETGVCALTVGTTRARGLRFTRVA